MLRDDRRGSTARGGVARRTWLGGTAATTGAAARGGLLPAPEDAVKWAAAELRKGYGA